MKFATPEEAVLVLGTTLQFTTTAMGQLDNLLVHDAVDWGEVLRLAELNRVSSLLHSNLSGMSSDRVPESVKSYLYATHYRDAQLSLRLKAELIRVLSVLAEHNIPVIPLKGPVLAELYYGNLALRECGDLDILVLPRHFEETKDILLELGYTSPQEITTKLRKTGYHLHMQNGAQEVVLELHWQLAERQYPTYRDASYLWEDARKASFGNIDVLVPRTENLLLFLSSHAFKHFWGRLRWITDIAQVVEKTPQLDWQYVTSQATRLHATNILWTSLFLASELQQVNLPHAVTSVCPEIPSIRREIQRVAQELSLEEKNGNQLTIRTLRRRLSLLDTRADQLRFIQSFIYRRYIRMLLPTSRDMEVLSLPRPLYFLYFIIRPLRFGTQRWREFRRSRMHSNP